MSNKAGIDSAARTARLHPPTSHRKPYRRENVPCDCGGVPQPKSSREISDMKRRVARINRTGKQRPINAKALSDGQRVVVDGDPFGGAGKFSGTFRGLHKPTEWEGNVQIEFDTTAPFGAGVYMYCAEQIVEVR